MYVLLFFSLCLAHSVYVRVSVVRETKGIYTSFVIFDLFTLILTLNMEITKTIQNKSKILHLGFSYVLKKKLADGWLSYECERRRRYRDCTGKIRVKEGQIHVVSPHSHAPDPAKNEAYKVIAAVREQAQSTNDRPQQILGNALRAIPDAVAADLPTLGTIRRNIRRQRRAVGGVLPVPASRAALPHPLPQEYTTTNAGDPFLRYDSGDQDRILIFATDERLALLENNVHWFIDGTFDAVPLIYTQLFTIHARLAGGKVIPCAYVFLPNKTQVAYTQTLRQLRILNPNLNPQTVLIDFEQAIKNSLEAVFPGVIVKGCYFHFTQNIWRRIQANGLQDRYQHDHGFVTDVRMIAALAFVPENDLDRVYTILSNNVDAALDVILDYMETNYIGAIRRGRFRRPLFPYGMWGVHDRVIDDLPRTNNAVEGWHNRFNRHVGSHHADIWKIIDVIKKEEDVSRVELVHIQQGRNNGNPNPVYVRVSDRIEVVVGTFANVAPLDYLRNIAHNITV